MQRRQPTMDSSGPASNHLLQTFKVTISPLTHRHTDTHTNKHMYIYMTASNGQHRCLSAAAAALKYEYVFLGFCQQASMSDATHWDLTKKTRARSSGISHIHKNGALYEPRTHVQHCSGQAGVSITPVAADPPWLTPTTTTEHHQSNRLIQTHA